MVFIGAKKNCHLMNEKIVSDLGKITGVVVQGIAISLIVLLSVFPLSCRMTEEGIEIIGGDFVSPKLNVCRVIDDFHIELCFTEKVKLTSVSVCEKNKTKIKEANLFSGFSNNLNDIFTKSSESEKQILSKNIFIEFCKNTEIGKDYIISGVVEDIKGNSLTFAAPFSGYNKNIPKMVMTEFQPIGSSISSNKNRYRNEYVKFEVLEDGNLFGLVLRSCYYENKKDFKLPPLEVKAGDVLVIHMRNKGEQCVSELGNNLQESGAPFSFSNGRDLWFENESTVFQDNCDVIYLKDTINDEIIDGCMYSDGTKTEWPKQLIPYVEELVKAGIVKSSLITDAINSEPGSGTHPLRRNINIEMLQKEIQENNNGKVIFPIENKADEWSAVENLKNSLEIKYN